MLIMEAFILGSTRWEILTMSDFYCKIEEFHILLIDGTSTSECSVYIYTTVDMMRHLKKDYFSIPCQCTYKLFLGPSSPFCQILQRHVVASKSFQSRFKCCKESLQTQTFVKIKKMLLERKVETYSKLQKEERGSYKVISNKPKYINLKYNLMNYIKLYTSSRMTFTVETRDNSFKAFVSKKKVPSVERNLQAEIYTIPLFFNCYPYMAFESKRDMVSPRALSQMLTSCM